MCIRVSPSKLRERQKERQEGDTERGKENKTHPFHYPSSYATERTAYSAFLPLYRILYAFILTSLPQFPHLLKYVQEQLPGELAKSLKEKSG